MLENAKVALLKARQLVSPSQSHLRQDDVAAARHYIANYWPKLERYHPKDDETLLGLPNTYLVPAYERGHSFDFNELYYWDSYFMVQGMLDKNHKDLVETESGWDMTPRFGRKCLHFLPVDLNALLYKYEIDFARAAHILGNRKVSKQWEAAATSRKRVMNELMWSKTRGPYYDYDFSKQKRGNVSSLASYYPLWAGMVDDKQAKQLVKSLRKFEQKGGLSATDQQLGQLVPGSVPTQWAYPNGWAPLHFLVVKGLQRYGYHVDAR